MPVLLVLLLTLLTVRASAQSIDPGPWVANGPVNAVVRNSSTIYLGGEFTQVGPASGNFIPIDAATGLLSGPFAKVGGGPVYTAAPDGSGGWYIGGAFRVVNGQPRSRLAHILANGTLSPWNPGANDEVGVEVTALAVSGSKVYLGGSFSIIDGQSRFGLAAVDAATGAVTSWNPNSNSNVQALVVSGTTVYVGGYFTNVGGQSRNRIAALDATTGAATAWNPNANANVDALVVNGATVYAGGYFTTIGGQTRNYLAAIDATTGAATSWNPNANAVVFALAMSGTTVYAGGFFWNVGGQSRNNIAALDATTGAATSWNPNSDHAVSALVVSGATIYAGGSFSNIGGQARNRVAALDAATGTASSWNPNANFEVLALGVSGSTVYAGGNLTGIGGQARNRIAALDASTGALTAWNPNSDGAVRALALNGSTVYAGGEFTTIGGQTRNRIAAVDAGTGAATAWNPDANNNVDALVVNGSTVYAGGDFNTIGGQVRGKIAALDAATGAATAWNPNALNSVYALAVNGSTVYAGGEFTIIGGQTRSRIAALDAATGAATAWNPNANDAVYALVVSGSTVYVSGAFTTIGGQTRNRVATLDASSAAATAWNPNANNAVRALVLSGPMVYVGGFFTDIGGQPRNYIAALDAASGAATAWNPNADFSVYALAVRGPTVSAGGNFRSMGGLPQSCIATMSASPAVTGILPSVVGNTVTTLTASVFGSGLVPVVSGGVTLMRTGHPDIAGNLESLAEDGTEAIVTFNLAGADTGLWDVVVTTVDAQTATLANGFRIAVLDAPALRVSVLGPSLVDGVPSIRRNRRTAFDLVIENRGNVDALAVPVWVAGIPFDATVDLDFTLAYPPSAGAEPAWSSATVPLSFTSAAGEYLTLVLPKVSPGTTTRRIYLTVPGANHPPFTLIAAVTPPWVDGAVFQSCITGGGITIPACMGSQLDGINAYLAANPYLPAVSGAAIWAKAAFNCEPGAGSLAGSLAKSEQALDYLGIGVETGTASQACGNVVLPRWREATTVAVVGAVDPNDKLGATGTLSGQQAMPYAIRFENVGNAAAQDVIVDDLLDVNTLDLTTVSLDVISFGSVRIVPPTGQSSYHGTVMMPAQNLRVELVAQLDAFTHHLTWYFNSYDATTGGAPPLGVGFLPVNNASHDGEGSVLFTVRPKSNLPSGTTIANAAAITFDDPPAVPTPAWQNLLDNTPPASRVKPFTTTQDPARYQMKWEPVGTWPDLRDYTVYAREDGGPYWAWRLNTVALSDTFAARVGHSYSFYTRSRDVYGNIEAAPSTADAQYTSTVAVGDGASPRLSLAGARPNPAIGALRVWLTLSSREAAVLELFDVAGRRVARRAVGQLGAGEHVVELDGAPALKPGLYFIRLEQGATVLHARAAVMR